VTQGNERRHHLYNDTVPLSPVIIVRVTLAGTLRARPALDSPYPVILTSSLPM